MSQPSSQQTQVAKIGFLTKFKVPLLVVGFMVSMSTYLFVYKPYSKQVKRRENQELAELIFQANKKEKAETTFQ